MKRKGASVRMVTLYDVLYVLSMAYCDEYRFRKEGSSEDFAE